MDDIIYQYHLWVSAIYQDSAMTRQKKEQQIFFILKYKEKTYFKRERIFTEQEWLISDLKFSSMLKAIMSLEVSWFLE